MKIQVVRTMLAIVLIIFGNSMSAQGSTETGIRPTADEYRGIWYAIGTKYSGGLGTYPQQIRPFAVYAPVVKKTFFCYGGSLPDNGSLLHMISYFDHGTGMVPKPRILLDKKTRDAHDNPCMTIDDDGRIWVFSNTHGAGRSSYIHRSRKPYDIDQFDLVLHTSFSYGQAWTVPDQGILFVHNRYEAGRAVAFMACPKGRTEWGAPKLIAQVGGQYEIGGQKGKRVGVAFNIHKYGGLDARTNLYYVQTDDCGASWQNADGKTLQLPLKDVDNPALVQKYHTAAGHLNVYLKDVAFDAAQRPVILYLTSKGAAPGPANDPRTWNTARWTGQEWVVHPVTTSDHNYDFGPLYIETDNVWRIIAPLEPGPQPGWTGGEVVMLTSRDQGKTWEKVKSLTSGSPRNHTYVRKPVNAHPGFYGFWADGNPDATKNDFESRLYFCDAEGNVFQLPAKMTSDFTKPLPLKPPATHSGTIERRRQ